MKTAALAVVLLAVSVAPVRAQEKPAAKPAFSFGGFFKNLKESLEKSAVSGERKKGRGAANVAAVRGAGQQSELADPNEPTLKGDTRSKRLAVKAAEDAELLKAAELVEKGKNAEALAAFQKFQADYPKSRKEDVAKAIEELKKLPAAAEAAPEAAPADAETKAE